MLLSLQSLAGVIALPLIAWALSENRGALAGTETARRVALGLLAQFLIGFFTYTLGLVFNAQINHQLPSRYRAGASSAINSVSRLLYIPVVLGFGAVSHTINVFTAAFILVVLCLVGLYSEVHSHFARTNV